MKILLILLFASVMFQTETMPEVKVSADEGILIDMNEPLSESYELDYKKAQWTSEQATQAAAILDQMSDIVEFSMDDKNERIVMKLKLDAPEASGWTITEWDNYLRTMK